MYKTRIVKIANSYYVEFRWCGSWLKGFFAGEMMRWTKWGRMRPHPSLEEAQSEANKALMSYDLNHGWNTKVISSESLFDKEA